MKKSPASQAGLSRVLKDEMPRCLPDESTAPTLLLLGRRSGLRLWRALSGGARRSLVSRLLSTRTRKGRMFRVSLTRCALLRPLHRLCDREISCHAAEGVG